MTGNHPCSFLSLKNLLKRTSGFTLIELIAVILILGSVMALVAPRFSDFGKDYLESDSSRVQTLLSYLSEAAETRKTYYRVWFDLDREKVTVESSGNGVDYIPEPERAFSGIALSDGVCIADIVTPGLGKVSSGAVAVILSPAGPGEAFSLRMGAEGRHVTVTINPYTGKVTREAPDA